MGVGLFVGVWVARYLGATLFGEWNYILSFITLFNSVSTLGLESIVVKELVKNKKNTFTILGTAFVIRLSSGVLTFILSSVIFFIFNPDYNYLILAIIVAAQYLINPSEILDYYFQSISKSKFVVLSKNISFLLFSGIKILLIIFKSPLIAFICCYTLELLIGSLFLFFFYSYEIKDKDKWEYNSTLAKKLLIKSIPLSITGFAMAFYMKIDQVMLGNMINKYEVGKYAVAVRISEIVYFFPVIIASSFMPLLVKTKTESPINYENLAQVFFDILLWLGIVISITFYIFSNQLIVVLYGNEFISSVAVLEIHVWATIFIFIGVANSQYVIIEGHTIYLLYQSIIGALFNIILNLYLIPIYKSEGAAWATLISYLVSGFISYSFFKKTQPSFLHSLYSLNLLRIIQQISKYKF